MKRFLTLLCFIFVTTQSFAWKDTWVGESGDFIMDKMQFVSYGFIIYHQDYDKFAPYFLSKYAASESTLYLKREVHEMRPNKKGRTSFPSGHTVNAFRDAVFIHVNYGIESAIIPYILASYVAFSRVHDGYHYTHDVIAGAVLSSAITYAINTAWNNTFEFDVLDEGGFRAGFNVKF